MRLMDVHPGIWFTLLIIGMPLTAMAGPFSGSWHWEHCDVNNPSRECGGLSLILVQRGDRICGRHVAATVGLTRLDEGPTPSVSGFAEGEQALLEVQSGRSGAVGKVRVSVSKGGLLWQLVEPPEGDYYFPVKAQLERSPNGVSNQLTGICSEPPRQTP